MEQTTPAPHPSASPPTTATEAAPAKTRSLRSKVGRVVSDKMQKTIVVEVEQFKRHRLYRKTMRRTTRFKAHDEHERAKEGDVVRIVECRRLSKDKYYRLAEIIQQREAPINVAKEVDEG